MSNEAPMVLWEATNNAFGESYVRCYVWAATRERAMALASDAFAKARTAGVAELTPLFSATDGEFVTVPSSDGWDGDERDDLEPATAPSQ